MVPRAFSHCLIWPSLKEVWTLMVEHDLWCLVCESDEDGVEHDLNALTGAGLKYSQNTCCCQSAAHALLCCPLAATHQRCVRREMMTRIA